MNYNLIGRIAAVCAENKIPLTIEQIITMSAGLDKIRESLGNPLDKILVKMSGNARADKKRAPAPIEPAAADETQPAADTKETARRIQQKSIIHCEDGNPANAIKNMDERMEAAKLPDHANIQPAPVDKKPLSKREQELYDYLQKNPDATMPTICDALGIRKANYYYLKYQIAKKGWKCSGVVYFPVQEQDD